MSATPPAPAHLGWRIAAAIYDLFPVLALLLTAGAVAMGVTQGKLDYHSWWYRLWLLAVVGGYYVLSWRFGGQTIGMRAWRLRLVDANQNSPGWGVCVLRFFLGVLALAPAGLGLLWCLLDRQRRGWHDLACGTRVLRLPKK